MPDRKILIGLVMMMGLLWWRWNDISKLVTGNGQENFQQYSNQRGKYSTRIPRGWKVEEATAEAKFISRTTFTPAKDGFNAGYIGQISITLIASSSAGQPFSTQAEFDEWKAKDNQEIKGIGLLKLKNEEVAGMPAIRLAEVGIIEENRDRSFWSITTWFKRGENNGYVNMMGNGIPTEKEFEIFEQILLNFDYWD